MKLMYQTNQKNHMETLFHMVYMFLCPQGDTLYTDNEKARGYNIINQCRVAFLPPGIFLIC
jgi:hypothetical protein